MKTKSLNYYMRFLHRYIGFFVIGFTIIYALSGIVLVYRDTDFLKSEVTINQQLAPQIEESDLGRELGFRRFSVEKTEGNIVYFSNGTYNKETGEAIYVEKRRPEILQKFVSLHMKASKSNISLISTIYGTLLLFLAISAFWMFKPKTKIFKKGMAVVAAGFIVAIAILYL